MSIRHVLLQAVDKNVWQDKTQNKFFSIPLIRDIQVKYNHKLLCSEYDYPHSILPIKLST